MKKKELYRQLHNLRNQIKPDLDWQNSNRDILLSQIKAQTRIDFQADRARIWHNLLLDKLFVAVYKPIGATLLIVLFSLGAYIASVSATQNSLPGDFLYNLKLASERVHVNLTLDDEKKTSLEMAFAERRLKEIKDFSAKKSGSSGNKTTMAVPLKQFQESLDNVKSSLAKLEKTDSGKALKLANLLDEKTKEYVDILENQQATTPGMGNNAAAAISASKATGDKALDVILQEFESGQSQLSPADASNKVYTRLESTKQELETVKAELTQISANKKIAAEQAALEAKKEAADVVQKAAAEAAVQKKIAEAAANTNTSETLNVNSAPAAPANTNSQPATAAADKTTAVSQDQSSGVVKSEVLPTLDEARSKLEEVQPLLDKAFLYFKNSNLGESFDRIKAADDILTLVNKVIQANSQYLDANKAASVDTPKAAEPAKPVEANINSAAKSN